MVDGGEQVFVLGPGSEAAHPAVTPDSVFLDVRRQFLYATAIIDAGEGIQQSLIGFLGNFGPPMQIGDPLSQGAPPEFVFGPSH